jgi:hypothetical protein
VPEILGILILALILAILLWGADGLFALFPGDARIKRGIKIVAIVVVAIWFLLLIASFFGIPVPWHGATVRHR